MSQLRAAATFMLDLVDRWYGTDNDPSGLPEEAEFRHHRATILAATPEPPAWPSGEAAVEALAEQLRASVDHGNASWLTVGAGVQRHYRERAVSILAALNATGGTTPEPATPPATTLGPGSSGLVPATPPAPSEP